jgi:hypothetical protein
MWNLLIDPETDALKIFDFNMGAKLGWEGDKDRRPGLNPHVFRYDEKRNDVKLAIFTLYETITRDLSFREESYWPHDLEISKVLQKDWEPHPEVRLEKDVAVSEYRRVLDDWVKARKEIDTKLNHYKQAPESIDWPSLPQFPVVDFVGSMMRAPSQMRQAMITRGEPFIKWYVSHDSSGGEVMKTWLMFCLGNARQVAISHFQRASVFLPLGR